jgi:thiamine biosynthesis protein ThiC
MSTNQLKLAEIGTVSPEMIEVAAAEGMEAETIRTRVANGQIVILTGRLNEKKVVGIGKGLRTKVNASIGTSSDVCDVEHEKRKARIAEETGADTLMELSAAGDLDHIHKQFDNLLFPEDARRILESRKSLSAKGCSMCGEFCALKNAAVSLNTFLKGDKCNS